MTENKPSQNKSVRAFGESEAGWHMGYSRQVYRDQMMALDLKKPYYRMMMRIWKKKGVKNKFTLFLRRQKTIKIGLASLPTRLSDHEYMIRRRILETEAPQVPVTGSERNLRKELPLSKAMRKSINPLSFIEFAPQMSEEEGEQHLKDFIDGQVSARQEVKKEMFRSAMFREKERQLKSSDSIDLEVQGLKENWSPSFSLDVPSDESRLEALKHLAGAAVFISRKDSQVFLESFQKTLQSKDLKPNPFVMMEHESQDEMPKKESE